MTRLIKTAIFPVAGLGTRFLPATKASPKEMLVVIDKPLIQYAVEEARDSGIENFIFVTSHGKSVIEDHFDFNAALEKNLERREKIADLEAVRATTLAPGQAIFVRQPVPLGLGHAVWCARDLVGNNPFALILCDDLIMSDKPCLGDMMAAHQKTGGNIVAVMDVAPEHVNRYGILDVAEDNGLLVRAKGVVEKPPVDQAPSRTAIVGRYILQPDIFDILESQQQGKDGEIQLTDSFPVLIEDMPFHGFRFPGIRFDCGTKDGWLEANIAFACGRADLRKQLLHSVEKYCREG